jgi:putative PIN family toxin of toxin-antitoxin system
MNRRLVLDTNVIISALLTPDGNPAHILGLVLKKECHICYDSRIIAEYFAVLKRPCFHFDLRKVNRLLDILLAGGISVVADASDIALPDETDRKFYEVAQTCGAWLITGNIKHYPKISGILSPSDYLKAVRDNNSIMNQG